MKIKPFEVVPLRKIPPFRIIGSKYNMLWNIFKVIRENKIEGKKFFDVFSGSAVVGRFFKKMFSIISSDNLFFSFVLQKSLITLNEYPKFSNFEKYSSLSPKNKIKKILEDLSKNEIEEGFIFQHYTPASRKFDGIERKYFTEENGKKIDGIRIKIEEWYRTGKITEDEYYYLISSLLFAVQKVANISGTYGAFNKFWDPRALKPLKMLFIEVIPSKFTHTAFCADSLKLAKKIKSDIAYIDPPYNTRQYITNYHILETIARYDNPKIKGKTGIREYSKNEKSQFCSKRSVRKAFFDLLTTINTKWIILSYNSEGILSAEEIIKILNKTKRFSHIRYYEFPYRRFKSQKNSKNEKIKELIFVAKVKT